MTALFAVKTRIITLFALTLCFSTQAQLTANFSANPLSGCAPVVVNFTDQSTGNPTQWRWDLGNGTISFLQNPSVTYFNPGQYTIRLIVTNGLGVSDTLTRTNYITINAQPTVNFTGNPLTGCYPLPVQFTDLSTAGSGSISSWQWDFGDGTSSSVQNPSHTYGAAGNYNVSLRIVNSAGCITVLTKPQYIRISTGVHADFSHSLPNTCNPPAVINFQNLSTGSGTLTYLWSFGDGGTSTLANPSHTYLTAGSYTVRLIVTNNTGCRDTLIRPNAIIIGSVNAAFTAADNVCVNSPLSINNTSIPAPVSSAWDFGDGTTSTATNPTKSYSTPGIYTIRLIANFGACNDTAFKTVTVMNKPAADFTAPVTAACQPPLTVSFTNSSPGFGFGYQWDFGDGNSSNAPNPVHTYTSTGSFDVTLIVTNLQGCSDTMRKVAFVKILPPDVTIDNLPKSDCAPLTWHFTATVNSVDPVLSYQWDFGDGNTSTLPDPVHTFGVGSYTIQLVITTIGGCTDTVRVTDGIIASTKPTANFSANPRDVCAHTNVLFTDLSIGNVTRWFWTFGDGGTSTEQNPVHMYEDTGYFHVQLVVWNNGCPDTIRFMNYIHVKPPIANFAASFQCIDPRVQTFTDQSIGADTWNWDFGDGNTSTLQSPVHVYADTGNYIVTLLVRNNTTGCEHVKTQAIRVVIERAHFTVSDSVICKNNPVVFTASETVLANIALYSWDFGDGGTATGLNPSHTYTQAGSYSVRLIITDILGCSDTLVKPLYIRVDGPTSLFAVSTPSVCSMNAVNFTDLSTTDGTHPIVSWTWDYGDGIIETLSSPPFQHTYASPAIYNISLRVTDSRGCIDNWTFNGAVMISHPTADFGSADTLSCPNQVIHFSNTSTGWSPSFLWDFGDGNTSMATTPTHNYAADGLYTVRLVVTDMYGCQDTITRPDFIRIISPHASFVLSDSITTCPPLFVNFTNTSQNYTAINWDFGDGTSTQTPDPSHFYSTPGVFLAKLTVTGPGGCIDSFTKVITVRGPQGNFAYGPIGGCKPLMINFTASTQDRLSFVWDFDDGTILNTTDSVINYTYTLLGNYIPKMILVDSNGCQVPIVGSDTIHVLGVDAAFNFNTQSICDAGTVSFTDQSTGNDLITGYRWEFGDGNNSSLQNPSHFYTAPGMYYPRLIVNTQSGCSDTLTAPLPVKIVASPQADFTHSGNGCAPLSASFTGQLIVPDSSVISWNWDLGNGNTSTLQNPPAQVYTNPAIYNIQLIATNSTGCKDTVRKTINAFLVPTINAGADTLICRGRGITIQASGADQYTWTPSTGLSCSNCPNPVANPDSLTRYTVTGTTLQGCSNTDTVEIRVKQKFEMNNSAGDTLCKGSSVRLFARGANSYVWSPSTALTSTTSATPLASPSVTTTYRVIGSDDVGCFKDTGFITVKVYPIPTVEAGKDVTINVGQSIDLSPTVSPDVTTALWSPTSSIVGSHQPGVTVKPMETTEYTVEVRNAGGCRSRDRITVFVLCNGANVFIPNTFSPNGDGMNDVFYPRGTGLFRIRSLRIFNRWGEIMYDKSEFMPNDVSAGWDGRFRGQKLNTDVFVYTIEIVCNNSSILTYKGDITLLQ
ncbi:MAG: PKD domain-containing protein [Chitinophagaceae bacterium]|nr:PKD domain-containing protein [Chitinophagaceae bacterium]